MLDVPPHFPLTPAGYALPLVDYLALLFKAANNTRKPLWSKLGEWFFNSNTKQM